MDYPLLARMPDGTARETAAPAPAASPEPVITARSAYLRPGLRGPAVHAAADARRTARRRHRPADHPVGRAAVLAHLTGWLMPHARTRLRRRPDRDWTAGCATARCPTPPTTAVAARAPAIAAAVSGPALAAHVTGAMRAALDEGRWACDAHEPQWLAPAWQWAGLLDELRTWDRDHPGAGPHPRTQDLEARYSRAIPGRTCAEQAATVQRWHDAAQRDPGTLRAVAFGVRSPSAVERAVGARTAGADWDQRLADALTDFPDSSWAPGQLRAAPPEGGQ